MPYGSSLDAAARDSEARAEENARGMAADYARFDESLNDVAREAHALRSKLDELVDRIQSPYVGDGTKIADWWDFAGSQLDMAVDNLRGK